MIKAGCAKNIGKEHKVKTPVGKKCPLKTVALAVDEKEKAIFPGLRRQGGVPVT